MNGIASFLPVAGALAVTLGLFLVAVRLLKRTMPGATGRPGMAPPLTVTGRVHLAPRQGIATVQAGGRTLLVSFGEGGVRLVTELDGSEAEEGVEEEATAGVRQVTSPSPSGQGFASALSGALGRRGVGIFRTLVWIALAGGMATLGAPELLEAQVAPPQLPPSVESAQVPGTPPTFDMNIGGAGDGEGLRVRGPVGTVLFMGALTLLPTLLLLMTSFTRILIVLHLLKQALGTQTAPPAHLLSAMALLLTAFIMGPTLQEANEVALVPWLDGEIDEAVMLQRASGPFREFMLTQVREEDLATFAELRTEPVPATVEELPLVVVTSAFVTSELRSAFQMGFAIFLPFVVIDLVVASVLMSMGMFMLPPVMISLPFKLLLFVMVDGWSLLVGSLVRSFY